MKAVFYHKPDSNYDDHTGERYHFPHIYLSRVKPTIGDWIVYYGPLPKQKGRYYSGIAKVRSIRADPSQENHYYADLIDYIDFDRAVEYKENGGFEKRLVHENGTINNGMKVQAVRKLEEAEFAAIVSAGLSQKDEWPDRIDETASEKVDDLETHSGFTDTPQADFSSEPFERAIIESLTRRKWRDRKFQQNIRIVYDRTCAFTGLRLINGLGRPEVEAAHIRPVKNGGNDSIRNGIALSATVHWMFDRGLLSLADDFTIMESRHLNYDVSHLLNANKKAKVPKDTRFQPHPHYLNWHRENVFKH
jgi:putative restriction endonuclease